LSSRGSLGQYASKKGHARRASTTIRGDTAADLAKDGRILAANGMFSLAASLLSWVVL